MRSVFAAIVTVLLLMIVASPASAQIPQTFRNLQVLPQDIPRAELVMQMRAFSGALGVRCTHCHVGPDNLDGMDFATDEKPSKHIARTMMRMVRSINADFMTSVPAADSVRQQVSCLTCHRREITPPRSLSDMLLSTIASTGVPAAIEQYQKLRAERLDAGLYDFREPTLNIVATTLREQKKFDDALEILRLNATMFPKPAMVQINLGDTAVQKGDLRLAESFYVRALEIEPAHAVAIKSLAAVLTKLKQ